MEGLVPSRWLAQAWINFESIDFYIDTEQNVEWNMLLIRALRDARRIKLSFPDAQRVEIAKELSGLLAREHDRGYIFSPFTTVSATRTATRWQMTLHPSGELVY
jgi:hypothetical protein